MVYVGVPKAILDIQQEFKELLDQFRKMEDGGVPTDKGWHYFDLNEFPEGIAPDVCFFYNNYSFRIRKQEKYILFCNDQKVIATNEKQKIIDFINGFINRIMEHRHSSLVTDTINT